MEKAGELFLRFAGVSVSYKKPVLFDDVVGISVSVKKYSGVVLELAL